MDIITLRVIWWMLLGILFMGFAVMDGFDLGALALLPLVARKDEERRIVLNVIGPVWEGNQVWIILGAGAIFAAWPLVYSVAFSVAYIPVLLLLLTMGISRPVSIKYRSKLPNATWRSVWDWTAFCGGFFPAIIFGVLVGNIFTGIPFYFDNNLQIHGDASFLHFFSPFALWCGLASLAMLVMHGGLFLAIKTENAIQQRAMFWSRVGAVVLIFAFVLGGYWVAFYLQGYQIVGYVNPADYSNPLHKEVISVTGAWMQNYKIYPLTMSVPILGIVGAFLAFLYAKPGTERFAFICSSLSEVGVIGTVGVSMFPFILPSSTNLTSSLLVWDASSSYLTLFVMLFATIIFLPIILVYSAWVYRVMRGKVTKVTVKEDKQAY